MNKEQQELLGEAYRKYCKIANSVEEPDYEIHVEDPHQNCTRLMTTDEFINICKTDSEFSQKWGLKIEERELDMMERWKIADLTPNMEEFDFANYMCDKHNVPTKLITITYNDKTIEMFLP